jgi:hypothetical protein
LTHQKRNGRFQVLGGHHHAPNDNGLADFLGSVAESGRVFFVPETFN